MEKLVQEKTSELNEISKLIYSKGQRKNVSKLLKRKLQSDSKPLIAMIYGKTAETFDDIEGSVGQFWDRYGFESFKINITNKLEIVKAIKEIDITNRFDVILIFRGGGKDALNVFNSLEVIKAASESKTPFVTAIAHAVNEPLIERVADRSFPTPSNFGSYLHQIYVDSGTEDDLTQKERILNEEIQKFTIKEKSFNEYAENFRLRELKLSETYNKITTKQKKLEIQKEEKIELENNLIDRKHRNNQIIILSAICIILLASIVGIGSYFISSYLFESGERQNSNSTNQLQ